MHIVFHSFYSKYNISNTLFNTAQSNIGDDLLSPFVSIAAVAKKRCITLTTSHNVDLATADAIVFVEFPRLDDKFFSDARDSGKPLFLITLESPIIKPDNYSTGNHHFFKKVFTWSDDLIKTEGKKYIKINYSFNIPESIPLTPKSEKKLLTLIAGNKNSNFPDQLYSQRKDIISYMEKYHIEDFDFFGIDWDFFVFGKSLPERVLNKLRIPRKLFKKGYKSYCGSVLRKNDTLKRYAFSVCYENVKNIDGYITEKLFDSFFAGCVPIYLGAANIDAYVPTNSFIDMRKFASIKDLYTFIRLMPEDIYMNYLENIQVFLNSQRALQFSNATFSETIIEGITNHKQ